MSTSTPELPNGRRTGRRIAIVAGAALGLLAVASISLGGVLIGTHATKRDAHGFYTTGEKTLATPTHALVAERIDVGASGPPGWLLGKNRLGTIRIAARGAPGEPIFVGIARRSQVDAYLAGVARDEIADFEVDPLSVTYDRRAGTATPAAPTGETFWASRASGSGRQTVTWPVQRGNWAAVVMNADGTPGVRAEVRLGAKTGFVLWIAGGLLALGALLAGAAVACCLAPRRRKPRALATAAKPAMPGFSPPATRQRTPQHGLLGNSETGATGLEPATFGLADR